MIKSFNAMITRAAVGRPRRPPDSTGITVFDRGLFSCQINRGISGRRRGIWVDFNGKGGSRDDSWVGERCGEEGGDGED